MTDAELPSPGPKAALLPIRVLIVDDEALGRLRAQDRYALQAFDAVAIDYLVKPFD